MDDFYNPKIFVYGMKINTNISLHPFKIIISGKIFCTEKWSRFLCSLIFYLTRVFSSLRLNVFINASNPDYSIIEC
jgi:hypothetical protein